MNKVNIAIVVIAAALLLVVGNAQTGSQGQQAQGPLGRYQLFVGEHVISASNTASFTQKEILRIDTFTGETRQWVFGRDKNGNFASFWANIAEK